MSQDKAMSAHETHRCWDISASDPLDRCIKVVKGLALNYLGADFASDTKGRVTAFNDK